MRTGTKAEALSKWEPAGSYVFFRVLFGLIIAASSVRFMAMGWIESIYTQPEFHFTYPGFRWVQPLPTFWLYAQFGVMSLCGLAIAAGRHARVAAGLFLFLFVWAELIEKAAYLNHYYLVSLLAFALVVFPQPITERGVKWIPRWVLIWLRLQVGAVYFFAGFAKLNADWLFLGEPLHIWLQAHVDWPVVGPLFAERWVAVAMCWGGAAFDLTLPFWLNCRRSRGIAYAVALGFHTMVGLLFPIGVFPFVMLIAATVFFEPDWTGRLQRMPAPSTPPPQTGPLSTAALAGVVLFLSVQLLLPLRHVLLPGSVNWTESGFRFSWRVMLVEKTGLLEYRVVADESEHWVYPSRELTYLQFKMLSTQFDMILEYAHVIEGRFADAGYDDIEVFAESFIAMNGHPNQRAIDPDFDLTSIRINSLDRSWVLPRERRTP